MGVVESCPVCGDPISCSLTLFIWPESEPTKLLYHPKQKPRRGEGLRQINTCLKVPLMVNFLDDYIWLWYLVVHALVVINLLLFCILYPKIFVRSAGRIPHAPLGILKICVPKKRYILKDFYTPWINKQHVPQTHKTLAWSRLPDYK